jgi:signal transduction histidine kinase
MTDQALTRLLRGILAVSAIAAVGASVVAPVTLPAPGDLAAAGLSVAFGVVAWIGVGTQPRNRLLWIMTTFVVGIGVITTAQTVAAAIAPPEIVFPLSVETQVPADLPAEVAWITAVSTAFASLTFVGFLIFGTLLFPDGRLPSRRWRPVAAVLALFLVASFSFSILQWHPSNTIAPYAPDGIGHAPLWQPVNLFILWGPLVGLTGMVIRFRRSDPAMRSQFKWIILGSAVFIPCLIVGAVAAPLFTPIGGLIFVAAYGIAITRYRLFDVDVVISRTVVFGSLAAFIGLVYVAVVVGVGALVGSGDEPNTGLALVATAVVAVAFQPVRRRLEKVANRLVFGRRATPYEVLSDFSRRVAATGETPFDHLARSLVEGTRAERVVVSVAVDGATIETAAWPEERPDRRLDDVRFPIEDEGVVLGSLDLQLQTGEDLKDDDRRLAEELASGMGLALRNQLLTERLGARVEELRQSRRRLVALQDETRRRLERDLHDGAQQQLVALKVKLGLARAMALKDGASDTAALLDDLNEDAGETVEAMRDFARGVYPPLLEAEGLGSAITALSRRTPVPVSVDTDGIGRYDREVEATVYFCVAEALRSAMRHSGVSSAAVVLTQDDGTVRFEVHDDGVAGAPAEDGDGMTTMRDRVDAVAGSLVFSAGVGEGTIVAGRVPVHTGNAP